MYKVIIDRGETYLFFDKGTDDIDYKKDGTKLKRMAETKNGFTPLKDNLEIWINKKIKEITDKM